MRILVDVRHHAHRHMRGAMSGVGEYTVQLLRALFAIDTRNEYVLLSTGLTKPDLSSLMRDNVSHIHVPVPNKLLNLSLLLTGKPFLDRLAGGPFDLFFLPNHNITRLSPGLPLVLTVHDLSWHIFPKFYSHKMQVWHRAAAPQALASRAQKILVPSEATKRDVTRSFHLSAETITVVPHGVDPLFTAHAAASDHGVRSRLKLPRRFALFLGTLEPRKNVLAIIEGVKNYRLETRDDLHLVLAGAWGWNAADLRQRLQQDDVRGWVHHLGYVRAEDRPALYRSAQLFVWPSVYEGFGLPVLEAMASGTPVITSTTSSLPELTETAAIHVHPYNSRDLTSALTQLLKNDALQNRLRAAGLRRASQFSWEQAARQTLETFSCIKKAAEQE